VRGQAVTGDESLKANLQQVFSMPPNAVEWLLMLWQAIQVFDDIADGDPVERQELNATIWNTLVAIGQNSFWQANQSVLAPLVGSMILKWQASDTAERQGKADAKSFVWRAGYYDVVLMSVQLCHGVVIAEQLAHHVMDLYGESFEEYMKEFTNA
jgi:hypothetical protein